MGLNYPYEMFRQNSYGNSDGIARYVKSEYGEDSIAWLIREIPEQNGKAKVAETRPSEGWRAHLRTFIHRVASLLL